MSEDYWFARRFPLSDPRSSMSPVNWKGWLASLVFVLALGAGATAFAYIGASGNIVQGGAIFAGVALVSGAWFVSVSRVKGDRVRCVADYEKGKVRV